MLLKLYSLLKWLQSKIADNPTILVSAGEYSLKLTVLWNNGVRLQRTLSALDIETFDAEEKDTLDQLILMVNNEYTKALLKLVNPEAEEPTA